jgi:arylsulfatase A-like enzyme/tetratricopeptide (TPR) repeat protein
MLFNAIGVGQLRRWYTLNIVLAFAVLLPAACRKDAPGTQPSGAVQPRNVLFVTFDTTRADYIGCYGRFAAKTPALDALAARGTRFEHAYCQVPLTLPSHASMMTGRFPRELGVRDNGRDGVSADHVTLAELARQAGFRTGAFVSSFVLDARFGLDQGFEVYDDEMKATSAESRVLDLERRGNQTADQALAWLKADASKPFFCWVHFYDPHQPYDPPQSTASVLANPYDAEIAFADSQLARLTDELNSSGRLKQTLVVVIGDHGESFGEHGEDGHGIFLYNTNLHVPFIVAGPGISPGAVGAPVEIINIYPTICELMRWQAPQALLSVSLASALHGTSLAASECYSESQFVYNGFGYAAQRSITTEQWKYVSSTRPELFDLRADPAEKANVISDHADMAARLAEFLAGRYGEMTPGKAQPVTMDERAQRAIQSLGYVGGTHEVDTPVVTTGLPDPKDMLPVIRASISARELIAAGRFAEALKLLVEPVKSSPDSIELLTAIAACYINVGDPEQAIAPLEHALHIEPTNPEALEAMGDVLFNTGRLDEAEKHYAAAAGHRLHDARSFYKHALTLKRMNRPAEAAGEFKQALECFPGYEEAANELIALSASPGGAGFDGVAFLRDSAAKHPADGGAQLNLGLALLRAGDIDGAMGRFREAIRLDPALGTAYNKLGICAARKGSSAEAVQYFRKASEFPNSKAEAFFNLGVTAEKSNALDEALAFYEQAIATKPAFATAIVAEVQLLLRNKRLADAVRVLKAGAAACPSDVRIATSLANILATNPDDAVRDGASAIVHAEKASALTGGQHPEVLGILAAAYAEAGRFDQAVETVERAIEIARANNAAELTAALESQASLYRAGRPYRESQP